ncbi:unnamed protein product [Caenorhabditis auriculariae]|uniref:Uncharacterized protein n=1 Tax=Caenorhabditis auriculariae TaxID=2777116 RepID=A0A8S1HXV2_9PELO|nr:unnamed protein product [Caenorhabditis auriculariae]
MPGESEVCQKVIKSIEDEAPNKKGKKKGTKKSRKRVSTITIESTPSTARIMSDIPEDVQLKKVTDRSGLVTYFKNFF